MSKKGGQDRTARFVAGVFAETEKYFQELSAQVVTERSPTEFVEAHQITAAMAREAPDRFLVVMDGLECVRPGEFPRRFFQSVHSLTLGRWRFTVRPTGIIAVGGRGGPTAVLSYRVTGVRITNRPGDLFKRQMGCILFTKGGSVVPIPPSPGFNPYAVKP